MRSLKVGVVSILEGDIYKEAKRLWRLFEKEYNSRAIQNFAHPHLSFQGGICEDIKIIDANLKKLSFQIKPFLIKIEGINVFEEPDRVIFMEVVRTKILQGIHKRIDSLLRKYCSQTFELFSPQNWYPHVTLACEDLTQNNFQKAKKDLENYHPRYKLKMSNICLVEWYDKDKIRIYKKYVLRTPNR
ncbi:MAG: 2'-5' RNA ligase family protein [candidate division Zixibacteria bacterium]|nr:2'-5' RNA ligase family protein [candidate division Zixibacteria bacterium]